MLKSVKKNNKYTHSEMLSQFLLYSEMLSHFLLFSEMLSLFCYLARCSRIFVI